MTFSTPLFAAILYLCSGALLAWRLAQGLDARQATKPLALGMWFAALAIHLPSLYGDIVTPLGLNLAFFNVLSLVTDMIALLLLFTATVRPVQNLGVFILPMAAVAAILRAVVPVPADHIAYADPGLQAHILLSILGYSLFAIASVQAVLLAVQNHHLRHRHPGGFIRALPPLESMEELLFQMIAVGYGFLTLSLVTGAVYLKNIFAQHLVHKTVLSIFAWLLFTVLLWGRHHFGWRGRTAIRWTLGGFVLLMLAYFGSRLVRELILGRG
jgi:ABC-type uncharacterized transport system permease subunit